MSMTPAARAMALVAAIAGCSSDGGPADAPVADLATWERFEAVLPRPVVAANPFDPAEIALDAEIEDPAGRVSRIPAYVHRAYDRELADGFERLTPIGDLEWRVRFTPTAPGTWRWRSVAKTRAGTETGAWQALEVGPPDGGHGFLRISPHDPRYLAHDDGTSYWALGENLCWYDGRGTFAYDDWLAKLAAEGVTYVRLWMPSWAFGLEWTERDASGAVLSSSLGDYSDRLDRAWQLDHVLDRASELGIHVMLSLQNHGAFSTEFNSEWEANPYRSANGGPIDEPGAVFTDPEARALFRRRLRYAVGRWGHSTHLLAWELWNETDLVDEPPGGPATVAAWHAEMAAELRRLDPYDHLVTTSTGGTLPIVNLLLGTRLYEELWELDGIDLVQLHLYTINFVPLEFSIALPAFLGDLARFGKPVLAAESGIDFRGPAETLAGDPGGEGLHDILWGGLFSESMGSGMTWWWDDYVDPEDLYLHFGGLAAFVDGVAFDREGFTRSPARATAPGRRLRAHLLAGSGTSLAWVENAGHTWSSPDGSTVEGGELSLAGVPPLDGDARWRARWMDPYTGRVVEDATVVTREGAAVIPVPPFTRDLALRLERR